MIRVRGLRLLPGESEERLRDLAAAVLRIPAGEIGELTIRKKSLDARRKSNLHYLYTVDVTVRGDEARILKKADPSRVLPAEPSAYCPPRGFSGTDRPVVTGFGPAGMFAALILARAGARPIVLERGWDVERRRAAVETFWSGGPLEPACNVQFGEGGAGTFSDGKLNTGIRDPRIPWLLEQMVRAGAPESILYDARPHVGTDVLAGMVKNLRQRIMDLGGEIRFGHCMADLTIREGRLVAVTVKGPDGAYDLPCRRLILATGHSARDTFRMLRSRGVPMEPKPFAMGVRIEHRQAAVDRAQYGDTDLPLPPADYRLAVHLPDGRGAYTFCMCPGGSVVAAASEHGGVVTNGMSLSARDGENANAALLVGVTPADFPSKDVLGGVYWQRELEQRAFEAGGGNYFAPAQRLEDFLARRPSTGPGTIRPTYRPGVTWCDLHDVLPEHITKTLEEALPLLERKMAGFAHPDAVLTAVESRSSSPVRVLRDVSGQSALRGLYPCGEGAGYAGGIVSAAVDGIRCAEAVLKGESDEHV